MNCWQILGIEPTDEKRTIKKAYARLLKACNPEEFPEQFQQLRDAYDLALELAEQAASADEDAAIDNVVMLNPAFQPYQQPANRNYSNNQFPEQDHPQEELTTTTEKEALIIEQAEQVEAAVADVLHLITDSSVNAAIEFCRNLLAKDYYHALDVREEFECKLVQVLAKNSINHFAFYQCLHQVFAWDIDIYRTDQIVISHLSNHHYESWFFYFIEPYIIDLMLKDVEQYIDSAKTFRDKPNALQLLNLLCGDNNQAELEQCLQQKSQRKLLNNLYPYLLMRGFVGNDVALVSLQRHRYLLQQKLVAEQGQVEWLAPEVQPQPSARESQLWGRSFGIICAAIFVFLVAKEIFTQNYWSTGNNQQGFSSLETIDVLQMAEEGNHDAQIWLGTNYLSGANGFVRNANKGTYWLTRAADANNSHAQYLLGRVYLTGELVDFHGENAHHWLEKAHSQGNSKASYLLSVAYHQGIGVDQDIERGNWLLQKAAGLTDSQAQFYLGYYQLHGIYFDKNIDQGLSNLEIASANNSVQAHRYLAQEYLRGTNVQPSFTRAINLLQAIPMADQTPVDQFWLSFLQGDSITDPDLRLNQLSSNKNVSNNDVDTINTIAWTFATQPNPDLNKGQLAIDLMLPIVDNLGDIHERSRWIYLDTMAAAYAANGEFDKAITTQEWALSQVPNHVPADTLTQATERLRLYQRGMSFVDRD